MCSCGLEKGRRLPSSLLDAPQRNLPGWNDAQGRSQAQHNIRLIRLYLRPAQICDDKRPTEHASNESNYAYVVIRARLLSATDTNGCVHKSQCTAKIVEKSAIPNGETIRGEYVRPHAATTDLCLTKKLQTKQSNQPNATPPILFSLPASSRASFQSSTASVSLPLQLGHFRPVSIAQFTALG